MTFRNLNSQAETKEHGFIKRNLAKMKQQNYKIIK